MPMINLQDDDFADYAAWAESDGVGSPSGGDHFDCDYFESLYDNPADDLPPSMVSPSDLQLAPGDLSPHTNDFVPPASITPSAILAAYEANQAPPIHATPVQSSSLIHSGLASALSTPSTNSGLTSAPITPSVHLTTPQAPSHWNFVSESLSYGLSYGHSYTYTNMGSGASSHTNTDAHTHIQSHIHLGGYAGHGVGPGPGLGPGLPGQHLVTSAQAAANSVYNNAQISSFFFQLWPSGSSSSDWTNGLGWLNIGLRDLLRYYGRRLILAQHPQARKVLTADQISAQMNNPRQYITTDKLDGDRCDIQGIDWTKLGVTRDDVRLHRKETFHNYVSIPDSDYWKPYECEKVPNTDEKYFGFRRMHVSRGYSLPHFQLRNLLACSSRTRVYYADRGGIVQEFNTLTGLSKPALRFQEQSTTMLSTIALGQNMLVGGGFDGQYCVVNLDSYSPYNESKEGQFRGSSIARAGIEGNTSGITNHIEVHSLRNATGPLASVSSNDNGLRILDLETQKLLSTVMFDFAPNCSAISPDRRLRVVVGDHRNALIMAAEPERARDTVGRGSAPDVMQKLSGHKDYGFSCAWAPDGYTLATGNQDRTIKIWDARNWSSAVTTIETQMSSARSLRFTPAGSGSRLLVVGEEADYVTLIDALSLRSQQTIDMFGELGGVTLSDDGQDLFVLCTDSSRGGIAQFARASTMDNIVDDNHLDDAFLPYQRRQLPGYRPGPPDWTPIGTGDCHGGRATAVTTADLAKQVRRQLQRFARRDQRRASQGSSWV